MFTRDDDGEPCGWWPARIVLKKGEVIMVLLLCDVVLQSANTNAFMPTLPDYPGVSRIRDKSPGLPYGWPNLLDKIDFGSLDLFGSFFQYKL